jgi:predicted tellurium resistance membrane protein TerC
MSKEKKITRQIAGDFIKDSKKIASQYFKEVKEKKTMKKNDAAIILLFFILFAIMLLDAIFSFTEIMKGFFYGGIFVLGIIAILISKMNKEKKITSNLSGDFIKDSKKIASQYFKEVKEKKTMKKNAAIILLFFILFTIMVLDAIFSFTEIVKVFFYGGIFVLGIIAILIQKIKKT